MSGLGISSLEVLSPVPSPVPRSLSCSVGGWRAGSPFISIHIPGTGLSQPTRLSLSPGKLDVEGPHREDGRWGLAGTRGDSSQVHSAETAPTTLPLSFPMSCRLSLPAASVFLAEELRHVHLPQEGDQMTVSR